MKKFAGRILLAVLCVMLSLVFAGCDASYTVKPFVGKSGESVFEVWDAVEETEHETGKTEADGWAADVPGCDAGVILRKKNLSLKPAVYRFSLIAQADNNSLDNNVLLEVSVIDKDADETIATRAIKRKEFNAVDTFQDFSVYFALYTNANVEISVHWTDYSYIKINKSMLKTSAPYNLTDAASKGDYMLSAGKSEEIALEEDALYYFDFVTYSEKLNTTVQQYDLANLLMTLQGLVNRDGAKMFVNYTTDNGYSNATDKFWLEILTRDGEFLSGKKLVEVKYPMTLLKLFEDYFKGFVLWDEKVPATVNVAATMCGVEDLLPLRAEETPGSLADYLTRYSFKQEKTVYNLNDKFKADESRIPDVNLKSTGSAKNDAYLWAKAKYLDTRKTNDTLMAYHLDAYSNQKGIVYYADLQNRYLANRDYYVANKAFFFDLNPWQNTVPDDDPTQKAGTDYETVRAILTQQNANAGDQTITIGGFVPWDSKYTLWTDPNLPDVVPSEWQSITLFSEFNCIVDADAYAFTNMANASVYMHFPKKESYVNLAKRKNEENHIAENAVLENKNYILFYMGDYDSAAWLNTQSIATYLKDPRRGEIPLMWPIAANNYVRAPHAIDFLYRYQTENDYFVYVNNGLGYFNPMLLKKEGRTLNGTLDTYFEKVKAAGEKFDLDVQGLIITETPLDADLYNRYAKTAPKGIIANWKGATGVQTENGTVGVIHEVDALGGKIETDAWTIRGELKSVASSPNFIVIRTTLRTASYITELYEYARDMFASYKLEAVDPYTFFKLYNEANASKGGNA